jgi:protein-S-isoprenylcysteine O-methyltransferase Ste14
LTSLAASAALWAVWVVSWMLAAVWTRRTAARPSPLEQAVYVIPTMIGAGLLVSGARPRVAARLGETPLWQLPEGAGWTLTLLVAAGLGFTWWARIWLGSLWSGSVGRKEGHSVVATGPYALVRHPIYSGLILAAFAVAIQLGALLGILGAGLIAVGFWLKARLEERFLSQELGAETYGAYRRRTPMLIPFWPKAG